MLEYNLSSSEIVDYGNKTIAVFTTQDLDNADYVTVKSFGEEWQRFCHFTEKEIDKIGRSYFDIISKDMINDSSIVADIGAGCGRWSKYLADKVKFIELIEPSDSVFAAARLLERTSNIRISKTDIDNIPFSDNSFDFIFCVGVLHHLPNPKKGMLSCVDKLKPGGHFLVYMYYNLEQRSSIYRTIFHIANLFRGLICKQSLFLRKVICDIIAVVAYMPLVLVSRSLKVFFPENKLYLKIPLCYYEDKTFNIIRNDAFDRFSTPIEHRFTRSEIEDMMKDAGLESIVFSKNAPYWHAVGRKK